MDKTAKNPLRCDFCSKTFSKKFNLKRHVEKSHGDASLNTLFTCNHCHKTFNAKFSLLRHLATCGKDSNRKRVKCALCEYTNARAAVVDHYAKQHDVAISSELLHFDSFRHFEQWKTEIERTSVSRYVVADKSKTAASLVCYYRCHRDGRYKARGANRRHLKKLGSNKIDGCCPAKMDVTRHNDTGEVTVRFVDTHVGHQMELHRIPLSRADRDSIAAQLASRVPFDEVLSSVRESADDKNPERVHLLTRKDLFNIEQLYNLNCSVRHSSDTASVGAWIQEMRESKNDSVVRFCKIQGELNDAHPELLEEDFLMVIMNDAQLDLLRKFGNNYICVDSVHSLNKSDFELTTVMVLDHLRQGFPCTFVFSNRSNQAIFKTVFSILRDILEGCLHPYVFMSHMAEALYNAWFEIMGPVAFRLFCTWHVVRDWKEQIAVGVASSGKQEMLLERLKALLEEQDEEAFERMLEDVLGLMEADQDMSAFRSYFVVTYVPNKHSWAYCFRKHSGLNRNLHLERMHETLRHIYLRGKTVKRLDKAINALMKLVRGKRDERLATLNKGKTSIKLAEIKKRHVAMETMEACSIVPEHLGESWLVTPGASSSHSYRIEVSRPDCRCELKCSDCDICIHAYVCSCPDSSVKWNMCSHVHLLIRQTCGRLVEAEPHEEGVENDGDASADPETDSVHDQARVLPESDRQGGEAALVEQKAWIRREVEAILQGVTTAEQLQVLETALQSARSALSGSTL